MTKRWVTFCLLAILATGCSRSAAPSQQPDPQPDQQPDPQAIGIYRDGRHLRSTGRELNGTIYLPLAVTNPEEKAPPVKDGVVQLQPGTILDLRTSTLVMRGDGEPIFPRLVEEDGTVWAPISYFRNRSYRVQYDAAARTIDMTRLTTMAQIAQRPYPEEVPPELAEFADRPGTGPRLGIFRPASGNVYWVFAYKGGEYRLESMQPSTGSARIILAAPGGGARSSQLLGVEGNAPWLGIEILLNDPDRSKRGMYVGETGWDRTRYIEEVAGRVAPVTPRETPTAVVQHNRVDLGLAEGDALTEEISGDRARVRIDHTGEAFYAHLVKEDGGWVLVAMTWGADCSNYTFCP